MEKKRDKYSMYKNKTIIHFRRAGGMTYMRNWYGTSSYGKGAPVGRGWYELLFALSAITDNLLGIERPECQSAETSVLVPEDTKADFLSKRRKEKNRVLGIQ